MRGYVNYYNLGLLSLLLVISLLTTQARTVKDRPSSVIVGFVYCNTKAGHSISGATISMECNNGDVKAVLKTNKHGKFKLPLGSSAPIKECQVSLLRSKQSRCATSSMRHIIKQQGYEATGLGSQKNLLDPITNGPLVGPILQPIMPPLLGMPSFGFPGGVPSFPIPFPPRTASSAGNGLP